MKQETLHFKVDADFARRFEVLTREGNLKPAELLRKCVTDYRQKQTPIQVDVEELTRFAGLIVTHIGEENAYFTHDGKEYFWKY